MGGGGGSGTGPDGPSPTGSGDGDDGVPPEEADDVFPEGDPCEFHEQVILDSPKPGALNSVSVDDVLPVELDQGAVVVVNHSGQVVGSIVEPWTADLKDCIEQGHDYEAKVLSIQGGSCEVLLRNA